MNSAQTGTSTDSCRRIHWSIKVILLLVLVAVAIFAFRLTRQTEPEPRFRWLTPAQFNPPGRLRMLYYRIVNLTAPVWHHVSRPKTQIQISSKILAARNGAGEQFAIGAPVATNENGV